MNSCIFSAPGRGAAAVRVTHRECSPLGSSGLTQSKQRWMHREQRLLPCVPPWASFWGWKRPQAEFALSCAVSKHEAIPAAGALCAGTGLITLCFISDITLPFFKHTDLRNYILITLSVLRNAIDTDWHHRLIRYHFWFVRPVAKCHGGTESLVLNLLF